MYAFILAAAGSIRHALVSLPRHKAPPGRGEGSAPVQAPELPAAPAWQWGTLAWMLTAVWTAMGVALWVLFPMTSAVLLPACTIAPLAWYWAARRRLLWHRPSPTILVLMLAVGFLLINAAWSRSPDQAARAVLMVIVMVGTLHIVLNSLPELDEPPLRAMAAGALAGLATGGAFICLEVFSDQSMRRLLIQLVPALQPSPNHIAMQGEQLARLAPYLPNANIAVLTLMLWPAALLAARLDLPRALRLVSLAAAAAAVATVLASEHASSQVALAGSGVVLILFRPRPKLAMRMVVAGWLAANLAMVPAAWLLYSADAHHADWLPDSARHRVVIWRHTAAQIPKAPLLGAGIGTGRALHEMRKDGHRQLPVAPGTRFELSTGLHSHNAYLQVWYETGAVGAAIVLALGLTVLWGLRSFVAAVQPSLAATFATCALLVATAYSIWAPWFMASLAMAAIFASLGAALAERGSRPGRPGRGA